MIRTERHGSFGKLIIDRPEKANSLTGEMLRQLTAALDEMATQKCGAVILTGAGRVFSAGADLDEARAGLATSPEWERLSQRMASMPCLTIAALNGTLAGGAFGMVLACDLRIAVPETGFFYPVMKLGFLPQPSDPRRMAGLIGAARAKMILMAGQKIGAEEALQWGLIDRIVPAGELLAQAEELAAACLAADPGHVSAIKAMIGQL